MIYYALNLLVSQLGAYIQSVAIDVKKQDVLMSNIASIGSTPEGESPDINRKIIVSLVNIEEETTLKNAAHYNRIGAGTANTNPPVYLNLYVLFSAHYDVYSEALKGLSYVIQFFQSKNSFSLKNSPPNGEKGIGVEEIEKYETIQLHTEIYSLSFEQLNHLWGSLGGKQWPSVLYKVRLVQITENRVTGFESLIEEVQVRDNTAAVL